MSDALSIWTVYDHPTDFPEVYVARRSTASRLGIKHTDDIWSAHSLEVLRALLACMGLTKLTRNPADDPVIVEVWL